MTGKKGRIKDCGKNHQRGDKKGRPKEGQKTNSLQEPKEWRELVPLVVGSYHTHNPFNVTSMQIVRSSSNGRSRTCITSMQIVRFNSNGRFRTCITFQHNLLLYSKD
jgi:hypothetical protein